MFAEDSVVVDPHEKGEGRQKDGDAVFDNMHCHALSLSVNESVQYRRREDGSSGSALLPSEMRGNAGSNFTAAFDHFAHHACTVQKFFLFPQIQLRMQDAFDPFSPNNCRQ